uniref:UNC80 domain-containing protein n=1 Tax=Syphacia muris TaxID=451379 RepID=A0A158R4L5_9BILA
MLIQVHDVSLQSKDVDYCFRTESKSELSDDGSLRSTTSSLVPQGNLRDQASLRRGLFKKKDKRCFQSLNADESDAESCPSTPRNASYGGDDSAAATLSSISVSQSNLKKKSGGKLHFALSLLKSVRPDQNEEEGYDGDSNEDFISQDGSALSEGDRRSRSRYGGGVLQQKNTDSTEDLLDLNNRKQSGLNINIPPRKLVNLKGIQDGVKRFAFLLEASMPGSFPDSSLIAALLDLKSPVLARAALLLECTHYVSRCNNNDWPEWIRSTAGRQLSFVGYRSALGNRGTPSATRQMHLTQRKAGKCFYQWAVQIGNRIQWLIEQSNCHKNSSNYSRRQFIQCKKELAVRDDLEDFFDEGIVNDESGEACPPALLLLACFLLREITAFLRETFQTIPRAKAFKSTLGPAYDKMMSNRRWSILSATFYPQQQQHSGSVQSIIDLNSTHCQERRISFSTNEEESSRRGSAEFGDDSALIAEKKVRKLAQGRQRLLRKTAGSSAVGSEMSAKGRRPSIRLRKQSKTQPEVEPNVLVETAPLMLNVKPVDWRTKRRASSMRIPGWNRRSKKKEASEEASGTFVNDGILQYSLGEDDESLVASPTEYAPPEKLPQPSSSTRGSVLRSCGAQSSHLETPLCDDENDETLTKNFPWIKTLVNVINTFDLGCTHERFCTPWCFERVYRQCFRLSEALHKVYGEDLPPEGRLDKRKAVIDSWNARQKSLRNVMRSDSLHRHTGFAQRRESAAVRQGAMLEKTPMALRSLLIEKLAEIEDGRESKAKKMRDSDDLIAVSQLQAKLPPLPKLNFLKTHALNFAHSPISALLCSALILDDSYYKETLKVAWHLLVHGDTNVVASAGNAISSLFILASVRCPDGVLELMHAELSHHDVNVRTAAIRRFHALWRNRFHVWLTMEEGAQLVFKVPPPGIDFTLPSPPIGVSQATVIDPPWMPHVKTKVEELSLKEEEEQATRQTIMTMTRTRRKQKQEMVKRAMRDAEERQSVLRQSFPLRATPIVQQAAYEPALFHHQLPNVSENMTEEAEGHLMSTQMPVAQPLFPSSILSVVPSLIEMLDDLQSHFVTVSDTARRIIWLCIVEDPALFLRHFLEKLTNRDRQDLQGDPCLTVNAVCCLTHIAMTISMIIFYCFQEYLMSLLRKLVLRFQPLPNQTAYSLLNYLFGFVMYYVRSPCPGSLKAIGLALSLIWLVAPYVQGLYFKDLKQTLRKEQCDQALLISANVPSAKKIIVNGPDDEIGGIPCQFPIYEETQFQQILNDSLEFFNVPDEEADSYFLVDKKKNIIHNPAFFVRDYYFFHRSFYSQLSLMKLNPTEAQLKMCQMSFLQRFIEIGKILLTHNALKHTPENVIPQRIFFLHDEFTHLPSFPRKCLESCFGMYNGAMGRELFAMDAIHKFTWAQLMSDMFEKMENSFMYGDLHLFINVINGVTLMHCEDLIILRRCLATYLSMAVRFSNLFASQGFFLMMPTVLRCYCQRQTNSLLCRSIEFVCRQFYILHRKPFFLQMAGAAASILDMNDNDFEVNPMKIKAKYFFKLLIQMENMSSMEDPLEILELVNGKKPLKAVDMCYRDDPNTFSILTDGIASCITVCAFAPESRRSYQMLLVLQAILPHFIKWAEKETTQQRSDASVVKHELTIYSTLCVEMKALINCCDVLARGRTFDLALGTGDRGRSFGTDSPQFYDPPTDESKAQQNNTRERTKTNSWEGSSTAEIHRDSFLKPRDALLVLAATFIEKVTPRLRELSKLASSEHHRIVEILDYKCHMIYVFQKLCEIALSLLKLVPEDYNTMGCSGLQKYFLIILPVTDWSAEGNRAPLNKLLNRLDKTIQKIGKKMLLRRRINWLAVTNWLNGLYKTLNAYPYVNLSAVKSITQRCLRLMVGDPTLDDSSQTALHNLAPSTVLHPTAPPSFFCDVVLKLVSFLIQALDQLSFLCSVDGIGPTADRAEVVLCKVLIPLFIRAASVDKDAPRFQWKDLEFCLNFMQNAITPSMSKHSLAPVQSSNLIATNTRNSTIHELSSRQGSVAVAGGHSATISVQPLVRETVCQTVFLALKVMMVVFQTTLSAHWAKIAKLTKDLISKKMGGAALYAFADFVVEVNLPISLLILPILQNKVNQKPASEHEARWQMEFKERVNKMGARSLPVVRSCNVLLNELAQELHCMTEDFATRLIENARSYTPSINEIHSEAGSTHSVPPSHRSSGIRPLTDMRRLSTTTLTKISRLAPSSFHKGLPCEGITEGIIIEDVEDENAQPVTTRVTKSPSLPLNRRISMWKSMRRKSFRKSDSEFPGIAELQEMSTSPSFHRRTRSYSKSVEEQVSATELTVPSVSLTVQPSLFPVPVEKIAQPEQRLRGISNILAFN